MRVFLALVVALWTQYALAQGARQIAGGSGGSGGGGSTSPGGSDTQVQFNDSSAFGGDAGLTYNKTTNVLTNTAGQIISTGGTVTANAPLWSGTQTWNNGAVAFTGIKANVTDTASDAASLLLDLQVGGSSKFNIVKNGEAHALSMSVIGNATGLGGVNVTAAGTLGIILQSAGTPSFDGGSGVFMASGLPLVWTSTQNAGGTPDLFLGRDAAGVLAQRNGANAQTFNVYGSYTDASNYTKLSLGNDGSGTAFVTATKAGTGSVTALVLEAGAGSTGLYLRGINGTNNWQVNDAGHFLAGADNTYDIGASGATRPRTAYFGTEIHVGNSGVGARLTELDLRLGAAGYLYWSGRSSFMSPSDGVLRLANNNENDFNRLQFGGATSSFPSLKRSSASLIARLADDSADATFQSGQLIVSGLATDATHTDSTVCQDTTTHQFYSGSGTLGICLGTSSARFKNIVGPVEDGLAKVMQLRPVNYFYKPGYGDSGAREQYGMTAEEVADVLPKLTHLDADGKPQSIDLLGMVPVLIKAVQELKNEIDCLRAGNTACAKFATNMEGVR